MTFMSAMIPTQFGLPGFGAMNSRWSYGSMAERLSGGRNMTALRMRVPDRKRVAANGRNGSKKRTLARDHGSHCYAEETMETSSSLASSTPDMASEVSEGVIANMRFRLRVCRRLAVATHDLRAGDTLRAMAEEIEADIKRLEEVAAEYRGGQAPP